VAKAPQGFVPLDALKSGPSAARDILADIRRIYFKTTRQTIEGDFAHAIELLKRLESEQEREKATVYMHGLAEMRKEWGPKKAGSSKGKGGSTTSR
jgi:ATP-dependent protease HslVU (ClpYQ) peptidase subunit